MISSPACGTPENLQRQYRILNKILMIHNLLDIPFVPTP
jgi:hypothetical protein